MGGNNRGFVSVGVMILMLVLAAVSLELADRSGHRMNMAALNQAAIQAELWRQATVEYGLWKLTNDHTWRKEEGQIHYYPPTPDYAHITDKVDTPYIYTLKVWDCALPGYNDCVMITASAAGSNRVTGIGIRIPPPPLYSSPTPRTTGSGNWTWTRARSRPLPAAAAVAMAALPLPQN